jgi:hypothetical protein
LPVRSLFPGARIVAGVEPNSSASLSIPQILPVPVSTNGVSHHSGHSRIRVKADAGSSTPVDILTCDFPFF